MRKISVEELFGCLIGSFLLITTAIGTLGLVIILSVMLFKHIFGMFQ